MQRHARHERQNSMIPLTTEGKEGSSVHTRQGAHDGSRDVRLSLHACACVSACEQPSLSLRMKATAAASASASASGNE